jgi:hypothetical protein
MIRKLRLFVALAFALSIFVGHAVWAGDSDGVTGYSMRLKNKSISTGAGDGVQGGNVAYAVPKMQPIAVVPNTALVVGFDRLWLVSVPFPFFVYAIWVR